MARPFYTGLRGAGDMDLSSLKLDIYDFLALIVPGFVAICELWIAIRGWHNFVLAFPGISATGFTALLIVSFGVGNLIQECGDLLVKRLKGPRYLKQGRDELWANEEGHLVARFIQQELGTPIPSVDAAFDYCLTRIGSAFPKRDVFLTISDLCRSFLVLTLFAFPAAMRVVLDASAIRIEAVLWLLAASALVGVLWYLSWTRMGRFRKLSEVTVFRVYLASREKTGQAGQH